MAVYVIAEAAGTHDLDLKKAKDLCRLAANTGANAIKFQYCSDPDAMAVRRKLPETPTGYALLKFERAWLSELSEYAHNMGLDFLCTVFLPQDIEIVAPWVSRFKVASLESQDDTFLRAHPEDRPLMISLGVDGALPVRKHANWYYLHCVSGYPTPKAEANIGVLDLPMIDGYSDHTRSFISGALAVACGATIIEKHVRHTLTSIRNPDYGHSFDYRQFERYVENIREAEILMGSGIRALMPSEAGLVPHVVR